MLRGVNLFESWACLWLYNHLWQGGGDGVAVDAAAATTTADVVTNHPIPSLTNRRK